MVHFLPGAAELFQKLVNHFPSSGFYQSIWKNRVKNYRKNFEFPALLSSKCGNLEQENLK